MKYLTNKYWESFSKIIFTSQYPKGKLVKDGIKFENLVERLLDLRYGENKWTRTATTYDGSKDFFLYENEKWAECKNYQTHISLDVLAPTLVMAQIYDVNEILFFSYSEIVKNTKEKIIRFAEKTNKRIFFFDDEALEQVILQYGNKIIPEYGMTLFSKYFPLFKINEINIIDNSPPQFECYYIQNPFFAHDLSEKNSFLRKTFPETLYLNQVIEILISVTNITFEDAEIIIKLNKNEKSDIYNFEYIMNDFKNHQITQKISAFQNLPIKIFLRPVIFKEILIFPAIDIHYKSKSSEYKHKISSISCKCNWVSEGPIIGSYYNELIDKHEKICLANSRFSAFTLLGPSGTGKTRILNECIKTSLKYNYRIIQFTGFRESETKNTPDSKYFLRELIFTLYNIPDGESITASESIMNFQDDLSLNTKKALEMIRYFEKNEFYNDEISEDYKLILFNRLCYEKTLFVVDNVQYFDNKIITLLSNLLSYCLNKNNNCNLSMLLVFNTDYISLDSTAIKLMIRLKGLELPVITESILGFRNDNEAMSYLKDLLKDIDLDREYMVKIISKTHLIPFNIRQTVEWLKDNKAIIYENNALKLDIPTFYQIIDSLPTSIYEILEDRWNSFARFLSKENIEACVIIFASINFFEGLSVSDIEKLKLNEDMLFQLKKWSFLKDDVNKNIIFEHDLVEKSFTQIYKTLPEKCIKNLDIQNFNIVVLGPIQKNYYYLYHTESLDPPKIESILNDSSNLRIPQKFLYAYLTLLANMFLEKHDLFTNIENWISDVVFLSTLIKDNIGIEKTIEFQDKVYSIIKDYDIDLKKTNEYSNFISFYCENNDESGNSSKAKKIINTYFNETGFDSDIELTDDQKRSISRLENRRHVYYRHSIIEPEKDPIVLKCIERAKRLSTETDYFGMQYTNLSDEGYLYYFNKKQKNKVKNLWEKACVIFNNHDIPDRTLNYLRKETQLALIDNELNKAKDFCQQGFNYIEDGEYAYQRLFFKNWFTLANIEILLMEEPNLNKIEIKENLASAHEYQFLLKSERNFNLHHLYAIACYYFGEYNTMFDEFKKAYEMIIKSIYKSHINDKINYILNNLWLMTYYDKNSFEKQLDFLKPTHSNIIKSIYKLNEIAFEQKKDGFYNESLLSMQDGRISIPTL